MKTLYRRTYMVIVLAALVAGAWLVDSPLTRPVLAGLAGALTFVLIYSRGVALDSLNRSLDAARTQTQVLERLLQADLDSFRTDMEQALRTTAGFGRAQAAFLCRLERGQDPRPVAWAAVDGDPAQPPVGLVGALGGVRSRLAREAAVLVDHDATPLLLVPVFDAGEIWGTVGLFGRRDRRSWTTHEVQVLRLIAGMMGAAHGRHRAESATRAALERAHASSEAKSRFLANMSHEIRTPLNCIVGLSEHLDDLTPTREQAQSLDLIRHSSGVLLQIISDILDLLAHRGGRHRPRRR